MSNDNKNIATVTVELEHFGIAFLLQKTYRPGMKPCELYEATRGTWLNLSEKKKRMPLKFAYAIHRNATQEYIVKEVYVIGGWFPAETQAYYTRILDDNQENRWEFIGRIAPDKVRNPYLEKQVKLGPFPPFAWKIVSKPPD